MPDFSQAVFSPAWSMSGRTMVEASAGTGKTYNIQSVYLRLVLSGLSVQQILVVTFTKAATRELRERLRNVLLDCRTALENPLAATEPRVRQAIDLAMVDGVSDSAALKQRLQLALMDFDGAAIFTIHGFCRRVLERNAFECGHDPDAELMPEQSRIILETCQDWWRRNAYGNSSAENPFDNVDQVVQIVSEIARHPDAALACSALPNSTEFAALVRACHAIWRDVGDLRGTPAWIGGGNMRAKKSGPAIDVSPLSKVFAAHAPAFALWRSARSPLGADETALAGILDVAEAIPNSGDAKPFCRHLKALVQASSVDPKLPARLRIAEELAESTRDRIRDRSALTYDAMLLNVRNVLRDLAAGPRLKTVLRAEFRAALIDEFQDTDPVQFEIFRSLFAEDGSSAPLLFVGDPKQAIYGFRGGDVFTYYEAKKSVDEFLLETNYRSERNLVAALNEWFRDDESGPTFRNDNVRYPGDLKAQGTPDAKTLFIDGNPDPHPLKVLTYSADAGGISQTSPVAQRIQADVAREIVRLLSDDSLRFGTQNPRRIHPSDVAVLVATHPEAAAFQRELLKRGVNAVRQATGNVFDADEARHLALAMQAMLSPGNAALVRGALATDLLPCSLADVRRYNETDADSPPDAPAGAPSAPATLADWSDLFREAGALWQRGSFIEAFRFLSDRLNLPAHVAGLPDGARRMADLAHLVELAHQAARDRKLGPVALLRWFARQSDENLRDPAGEEDQARTRLADDNDAVQIMTVFKSKGLEFPIVFVPSLWRRKAIAKHPSAAMLKYHENNRLVLNLHASSDGLKSKAIAEAFEEDLRLAYVALTRAVNRVYFCEVAQAGDANAYAAAYLLSRWRARSSAAGFDSHVRSLSPPPELPDEPWTGNAPAVDPQSLRPRPSPAIDASHGHASFTSLSPHAASATPASLDARDGADVDQATATAAPPDLAPALDPIFAIPGGAKLGKCWHEIFENIDFQASPEAIAPIVNDSLDRYQICPAPAPRDPPELRQRLAERRGAVHQMVARVLATPLLDGPASFALRDVPPSARRSELEFQFSLDRRAARRVGEIAPLLDALWTSPGRNPAFIDRIAGQNVQIPRGFMTGFVDLVFERAGRFYVVDWKSNQLARSAENFDATGLADEMAAHAYYLQYLVYSVAVHGFLSRALDGYDYDRHFGGVFYLFVRGMDGHSRRGVFADRPPKALVERLSAFLGGPSA